MNLKDFCRFLLCLISNGTCVGKKSCLFKPWSNFQGLHKQEVGCSVCASHSCRDSLFRWVPIIGGTCDELRDWQEGLSNSKEWVLSRQSSGMWSMSWIVDYCILVYLCTFSKIKRYFFLLLLPSTSFDFRHCTCVKTDYSCF